MGNFYNDILISLRRKYGKDELTSSLVKQNKDKDVIIGELKSEVDHYKYLLMKEQERFNVNINKRFKESADYIRLKEKLDEVIISKGVLKLKHEREVAILNENIGKRKQEIYRLRKKIKGEFD